MKKVLKLLFKIFICIIVLIIIFIVCSFIIHQIKTKQELKFLEKYDIGKIIEIDNKKVNYKIFNEDNKERTILLMSGSGVTDLALSFEPLARDIDAQIILINRPGYGFSSDSNQKAEIENIVNFYRKVLNELNITNKIFLMPHSISGMYAMYWAECFPNEISGIIGLDIGSPFMYIDNPNNKLSNNLSFLGAKLGLHRFIYKQNGNNTAIKNYDIYEKDYFKAIWYMNVMNPYSKFNLSEENLIKDNANKVIINLNDNYYNTKKLYIFANSIDGVYYEKYEREALNNYYKKPEKIQKYKENIRTNQEKEKKSLSLDSNTSFAYVEGPHMLYYYPSDSLKDTINSFLK